MSTTFSLMAFLTLLWVVANATGAAISLTYTADDTITGHQELTVNDTLEI